jgi:hypothetical protein
MRILDANIDGTAAIRPTAGSAPAFAAIAVTAGLMPLIGTLRGVDGALNQWLRSLSLNLRDCLDGVLGLGNRDNGRLQRKDIHRNLRLTYAFTRQFCHERSEEMVKPNKFNMILDKSDQTGLIYGQFKQGARP